MVQLMERRQLLYQANWFISPGLGQQVAGIRFQDRRLIPDTMGKYLDKKAQNPEKS